MKYSFVKKGKTNLTLLSITLGAICGVGIYLLFAINQSALEIADLNESSDNYIHFNLTKDKIPAGNIETASPDKNLQPKAPESIAPSEENGLGVQ